MFQILIMNTTDVKILIELAFYMGYDVGVNNANSSLNSLMLKKAAIKEFRNDIKEHIPEFLQGL